MRAGNLFLIPRGLIYFNFPPSLQPTRYHCCDVTLLSSFDKNYEKEIKFCEEFLDFKSTELPSIFRLLCSEVI